jgi:hypothetical protein
MTHKNGVEDEVIDYLLARSASLQDDVDRQALQVIDGDHYDPLYS